MNSFYSITLFIHSWNRWAVLILGTVVIIYAVKGLAARTPYTDFNKKSMFYFILTLHLQLLVGLLLYFVASPTTTHALSDFGAAMKDSTVRFWAVEHSFLNIIAIGVAQTGSILVKRKTADRDKHRLSLIWAGIALLLILIMIPMGMMGVDRPWFRF